MGLICDNLVWDITIQNLGIVNYFEFITQKIVKAGETETFRIGSTLVADQIISNVKQDNDLKQENLIIASKQIVEQSGEVDLSDYFTKDEVRELIAEIPGGGDYNFSVQDLDLLSTAQKVPTTMHITPDVDNTITGSNIVGKISANDQIKGGYLKVIAGDITISIDRTTPSNNIFKNFSDEPVVAFNAGGTIPPASLLFGCAFLNDETFIIVGTTDAPIQIVLPAEGLSPVEEVTFIFDKNNIQVKHKDVVLTTYTHPALYGPYWQLINNMGLPDTFETTFNFTEAAAALSYSLPNTAKDGDTYHLISDGILFDKRLLVGDYITVYGDKSNVTVVRLPKEQLLTTKVSLPITYYLQEYAAKELKAYYDTELRAVFVVGLFNLSSDPTAENNIVFEVDVSQIDISAPNLNAMDVIAQHSNNVLRLAATFSRDEKLVRVRVDTSTFGGIGESYFLLSNLILQATL